MGAYQKEVWFTIGMTALFLLAGNMGLIFTIFPVEGNLFGFPIMYIVPVVVGWFGVVLLTIVAGKIGNKIDAAIETEDKQNLQHKASLDKEVG
ncbi:hypothetical protein [Bacillus sp. CHD6a]|uniref:hypothetical protein n=1 Tax=Bacillus sp. CHD6a TaxID=1643452 RepID=UPI0006CD2FE4|nr:hypothetical protein [Bacillus sp. CHD6a]KPB05433.1 hypothetical protein AAV98_06745 [Bacillus sp. CHD6a]